MKSHQLRNSHKENINITDTLTNITDLIIHHTSIFKHIDLKRILICLSSNRGNSKNGVYGKLVPLRFKNGSEKIQYKGKIYAMPKIENNKLDQLYIIYFYFPKFFDIDPYHKLSVIFHELYHISPKFNGDIRRMGKVKASHGHSKKHFDSLFENEVQNFYKYISQSKYMNFLHMDGKTIHKKHNNVYCRRMKVPKPVIIGQS
ncbi:MAG: putative metallopeptidase [Spirochaetota bacterium]|nr:putative metallopeptidase [Spirochaetota bacterium]